MNRGRALIRGALFCVTLAAVCAPSTAFALFPPRYVVCKDDTEQRVVRQCSRKAEQWLPLATKRVQPLRLLPMEVNDVAEVDSLPSRRVAPSEAPPTRVVTIEGRNDYRCIGIPRGAAGILRVVSAPPGAHFFGHTYPESWRQTNMRAAGTFALQSAIPALRRELERPIPDSAEPWRQHELRRNKHYAARALADLGDQASAPLVLALLRSLERDGFNLWRDTLDTLPRLSPASAQTYALDLIRRATRDPKLLQENPQLFTDVLPLIVTPSPGARAVIEAAAATWVTPDAAARGRFSGACELVVARVRMGDMTLGDELRAELATDLRTQRAVACYSKWMPVLFPGSQASEAPVWMHRHRYEALLTWLARVRRGAPSAADGGVMQQLVTWLRARSREPDVAGDRQDRRFVPDTRARHLAALAGLGDAAARRALNQLIVDPNDDGTAPWIAAQQALLLELPGAADLAAKRLELGITRSTRRFNSASWPKRGALLITEQGEVIEALVRRGDARFALGLLSRSVFDRELTAMWIAREKPAAACEIVGKAAHEAPRESIDDAFWTLSALGGSCRGTMQRLTRDPAQPAAVRGMANEFLAMLRDKSVPAQSRELERDRAHRASVQRARIIFRSRE